MRLLYSLLLTLLLPVALWALQRRAMGSGAAPGRWRERLGWGTPVESELQLWVHAASMGEVQAASPLIDAALERYGSGRVAITTMTATGSVQVQQRWGSHLVHAYIPFDLPFLLRPLLNRWQPRRCVVMESELWPNLFAELRARRIPLLLANARMSPRSRARYARFSRWVRAILECVDIVAAQSEHDAQHYRELGAPRVQVCGNLKFDCRVPQAQAIVGKALRTRLGAARPIWVAASTHREEDSWALQAQRQVLDLLPDALLILVPRHPQRFELAWEALQRSGLRVARRSTETFDGHTQVLLGDSMGEMFGYLAASDLAFVGGSLEPIGGHNVLEPAALGLPVLFGPHMHNFLAARALLLEAQGAVELADASALAPAVTELLGDRERGRRMGGQALAALQGHQGATERVMALLDPA